MATNTYRGVDVRQSGDRLILRTSLKDASGAKVTSGTVNLFLYELQQDGTLKSFDFADLTFKSGALTTPSAAMTHRTGNNGAKSTGLWTYALTTLTGLAVGGVYFAQVECATAVPPEQEREFQFGGGEGDVDAAIAALGEGGNIDGHTRDAARRIILAALGAKVVVNAEGTSFVARSANDTKNRITATTTRDGNRTAVTLDGTP